jgi:hypothetical protein
MKEPCKLLIKKIEEHNAITKCPYCKQLFDIHAGMVFLEDKEISDSGKWGHEYFEKVMGASAKQDK